MDTLFKRIYLRSSSKQVIPTYINHSRPLNPEGFFSLFEGGLKGETRQTYLYMPRANKKIQQ